MELYPRIGTNFDIKVFTNCRFGMMSWAVLIVTYAVKQVFIYLQRVLSYSWYSVPSFMPEWPVMIRIKSRILDTIIHSYLRVLHCYYFLVESRFIRNDESHEATTRILMFNVIDEMVAHMNSVTLIWLAD